MDENLCKHGNYHCNICEVDLLKKVIDEYKTENEKMSKCLDNIANRPIGVFGEGFGYDFHYENLKKSAKRCLDSLNLPQAIETNEILNEVKADKGSEGILTEEELKEIELLYGLDDESNRFNAPALASLFASHRELFKSNAELSFKLSKSIYHPHCTTHQMGFDKVFRCVQCGKSQGGTNI